MPPADGPRSGAEVIRMSDHPVARQRIPREPVVGAYDTPPLEQQLAEYVEAFFRTRDLTLTDEQTANVFLVSLGVVQLMLDGALAQGTVGAEAHSELRAMIDGMRNAPPLV